MALLQNLHNLLFYFVDSLVSCVHVKYSRMNTIIIIVMKIYFPPLFFAILASISSIFERIIKFIMFRNIN